MNIIQAIEDPKLLRPFFRDLGMWRAWLVYLRGLFGLPIEGDDRRLFLDCTGLTEAPREKIRESYVIAGRRAGKSFISAVIAVYLSCFIDWKPYLSPGETGWIFILSVDKMQSRIIRDYIKAILNGCRFLKKLIRKETSEEIELSNRVTICIKTSNYRSVRGYTLLACIMEELAFWRSEESANPDKEVLAAVRPALSTIPDSLLIGISTPYSRAGVLWDQYKGNFGQPGRVLVWKAATRTMNPNVDADLIKTARESAARPPRETVEERKVDTEKKSILVVEDSITSRMLLKNILESAGYRVKTAVDGLEAFTELKTAAFDLVVSDIDMPRMNGFELTARIRSDKDVAEIPVVLVTALDSREDRERGIDAGANAYIVKSSFDQGNLLDIVRRLA
jgi:CheY-like chemotaxis protein